MKYELLHNKSISKYNTLIRLMKLEYQQQNVYWGTIVPWQLN